MLGPLPSTAPLHLALSYLATADLPPYGAKDNVKPRGERERVLVITSGKAGWLQALLDDDDGWLRKHGADYAVLDRLGRVDVRSCPSVDHLSLLLQLVGVAPPGPTSAAALQHPPGLIVIWDMAQHFLERDHGAVDDSDTLAGWAFKQGTSLSDYLQLVSSAKALRDHCTSLRKDGSPTQLIILEPKLGEFNSLPILAPSSEMRNGLATPTREKRVGVKAGIEWILGKVVGVSSPRDVDDHHVLSLPGHPDVYPLRRQTRGKNTGEDEAAESYSWEWT